MTAAPRSVLNRNPLNIRPGDPYEGLATPGSQAGFCNFQKPIFGFRAAFRNYITKYDRGVNTIRSLIGQWAPPGDNNNTIAYIESVATATGFDPDLVINLKDWNIASAVCRAQAEVEAGAPFATWWTETQMAEGAFRAGITNAPPPLAKRVGTVVAATGSAAGSVLVAGAGYTALAQPVVVASGSLKAIIIFAVVSAALAVLAAVLKPKTKDS